MPGFRGSRHEPRWTKSFLSLPSHQVRAHMARPPLLSWKSSATRKSCRHLPGRKNCIPSPCLQNYPVIAMTFPQLEDGSVIDRGAGTETLRRSWDRHLENSAASSPQRHDHQETREMAGFDIRSTPPSFYLHLRIGMIYTPTLGVLRQQWPHLGYLSLWDSNKNYDHQS